MITYLDTIALLKQYVQKNWSEEVEKLLGIVNGVGTSIITHTEMAATMSRGACMVGISAKRSTGGLERYYYRLGIPDASESFSPGN